MDFSVLKKAKMPLGRPREFDADKALEKALQVFWKKGFEGTSLPDLTRAMGINRPSLYAAFGNKQELFRKAMDKYIARNACMMEILNKPTARAVAESLLRWSVEGLTDAKNPRGCFLVQCTLPGGCSESALRREVLSRRRQMETVIEARFARAVQEGDLPPQTDSAALARYVGTITAGLSVQASAGASRDQLLEVVETAMRAWPQ